MAVVIRMSKLLEVCLNNLWTQRFTFARMGLMIEPSKGSRDRIDKHRVLNSPLIYIIMIVATSFELCTVCAFIVENRSDIVICSEALMHGVQMISSLLKMAIFLYKSRELIELIELIEKPFQNDQIKTPKKTNFELDLWHIQNRRGQLLAFIYFMMCAGTSISFLLMPVAMTMWQYYMNDIFEPSSTFRVRLPYDITQPHIYIMDCCLMIFVLMFFCCSTTAVDTLYGWFVFGLTAHYRRLTLHLERIHFDFGQDIKSLFHEHSHLLELVERFNLAFRDIAFVEVLLICILYCSVICQYIMPHTNQNFAFLGFFSMVVTTQLCIYGFGAEQVRHEAEQFSLQFYQQLPWHNLMPKDRKLLLLPMQRAQKETVLSAYFFILGRPLLVWIFRTAGSFTTLLNALRAQYEE